MKKFILRQKGIEKFIGKFDSKKKAVSMMEQIIDENNKKLYSDDENCLTPFDFVLEEVECKEVNEIITDFESARKALGGTPNGYFTIWKKVLSGNTLKLDEVTRLIKDLNPAHVQALIALNELFTIAQAWNKEDEFEPDFSNANQFKHFPYFVYDKDAAKFVFACTHSTAKYADGIFGSRLCFKTINRSRQFGEQFVELFNQVFLMDDYQL